MLSVTNFWMLFAGLVYLASSALLGLMFLLFVCMLYVPMRWRIPANDSGGNTC